VDDDEEENINTCTQLTVAAIARMHPLGLNISAPSADLARVGARPHKHKLNVLLSRTV